jgi:TPR repeat protein
MTKLATLLERGVGVRKDVAEARMWRRKAEALQPPRKAASSRSDDTQSRRPGIR